MTAKGHNRRHRKVLRDRPRSFENLTAIQNQGYVPSLPDTVAAFGPDEAWSKLRQGARNVAGVSWQIEVTTYLLAMGRAGFLKFRHFTPEGIEDVDCRDGDGFITYVQMKELGGGHGRMTASRVAEVISHASKYTTSDIVVVTDGELGSDLAFSGWEVDLQAGGSTGVGLVKDHLTSGGMLDAEADLLLGRTFLVQLPWDLRPVTEKVLADGLGVPPAISALTVSRLYDFVALASANQRATTAQTARVLTVGDVDAVIADIQSTVGLESLDEALAAGVCTPASYVVASKLTPREFLLGADGAPGLIAAGLDVIRPLDMEKVLNGFSSHAYSLLVGPSGAGKSVLLWRAARDVLVGASVLRVLKVATQDDVELLVRHVTLQRPSKASPLVVAADNLGRPNVGAWPDAVRRLREIPWVFLLGSARSEDFSPRLIAGGAALIELALDETTAEDIAEAVQEAGIELHMDPTEARNRAEGLLMEYLALITAGRRFRDVIAEQVEGLRKPDRKLERTLARLVTAAHSVGLGLEAEVLPRLLKEHDETVGDALGRLRGEHVILRSNTEWRGLHELRSATISELLHESPPPTLTQTFSDVAKAVALPNVGWFLRRVAQEAPQAVTHVADIVSRRIANTEDGLVVASALEGAERADSLLYAAHTLPIVRQHTNSGLTVSEIAMFAYPVANQGFSPEPIGVSGFDNVMQRMSIVAEQIGPRPAQVAEAIARGITGRDVVRLVSNRPPEFVARLLEAILDVVELTRGEAQEIYEGVSKPADADEADIYARIIYSLVALAGLDHGQVSSSFGDVDSRASMLTSIESWALDVAVEQSADGLTVVATALCPDSAEEKSRRLDWDISPRFDGDPVHGQAMRIAQRLADGCPEAEVVEIRTVSPSGSRYVIADHEPGCKRLKREVFKRRESVRRAVSYQAALRRLQASTSWTDLLREQVRIASELVKLLNESHLRLAPGDNAARRQAWVSDLAEVQSSVKALKARPVAVAVDPADTHAQIDEDERSHDPVTRAFELVTGVLEQLPQQRLPSGIAMNLEKALKEVAKAQQGGLPTLDSLGSPLPHTLHVSLLRLLKLQRAVAASPAAARLIRSSPESVERVIDKAIEETRGRDTALLNSCLSGLYSYRLVRAPSPDPSPNSADGCDLLLLVDLTMLDDLLADLRVAKDELRDGLSARVYVAAANEATVLPIALQLVTHIAIDFIPVPPETRTRLFDAADLKLEPTPLAECVVTLLQEFAGRSYAAALRRLRKAEWPDMLPQPNRDSLKHLAPDIPGHHAVLDPLSELDKQVMAEEAGQRPPGQLATVLNQMLSPQHPSSDEAALLQTVSMAIVLSLQ